MEPQPDMPKPLRQMTPSTAAPTPELVKSAAEQQTPVATMPPPYPPYPTSAADGPGLRPLDSADETKAAPPPKDIWKP